MGPDQQSRAAIFGGVLLGLAMIGMILFVLKVYNL